MKSVTILIVILLSSKVNAQFGPVNFIDTTAAVLGVEKISSRYFNKNGYDNIVGAQGMPAAMENISFESLNVFPDPSSGEINFSSPYYSNLTIVDAMSDIIGEWTFNVKMNGQDDASGKIVVIQ